MFTDTILTLVGSAALFANHLPAFSGCLYSSSSRVLHPCSRLWCRAAAAALRDPYLPAAPQQQRQESTRHNPARAPTARGSGSLTVSRNGARSGPLSAARGSG